VALRPCAPAARRRNRLRRPPGRLSVRQAVALGLIQGPAELLPVSSSGHLVLVPALLGWPYARLDGDVRKAFEVALHAGTAVGLLLGLRREVSDAVRHLDARRLALVALSFAPPAVAGLTLERPIEQRTGTPPTIAVGLLLGSALMLVADRAPEERDRDEATWVDGLLLGVAQACALMPGVSRNGATLTAARARGFRREDSNAMSRHVALPVILGATALKGARLARRGLPPGVTRSFAAGIAASFLSTLASVRLIRAVERDRPLAPYAAYRLGLAAVVLWRARRPWTSPAETSAAAPKRRPWSEGAGAAGTMTGDD
jgi:undecaprenyl-diphosphatase